MHITRGSFDRPPAAQDDSRWVAGIAPRCALALMWLGPATADVHDIIGPNLRGIGIRATLIGKISDLLGVTKNRDPMCLSLLVCPIACGLGALLLWMGSRARMDERTPPLIH